MKIYYKKKFWASVGSLVLGLALPGTCLFVDRDEDRDERSRYNTLRGRALTFRVLYGLNFAILAACLIGWGLTDKAAYIQTALPCMVLFIAGWITRIAGDFYYEFKG